MSNQSTYQWRNSPKGFESSMINYQGQGKPLSGFAAGESGLVRDSGQVCLALKLADGEPDDKHPFFLVWRKIQGNAYIPMFAMLPAGSYGWAFEEISVQVDGPLITNSSAVNSANKHYLSIGQTGPVLTGIIHSQNQPGGDWEHIELRTGSRLQNQSNKILCTENWRLGLLSGNHFDVLLQSNAGSVTSPSGLLV